MNIIHKAAVAGAAAFALSACASTQVPQQLTIDTAASIKSAENLSAEQIPEASLHLELARRGYAEANKLIDEGKKQEAHWALERAQADAELAVELAKAGDKRDEAQRELKRVRDLKKETNS